MTEYAIACGCGRNMAPDGRAGRGAFRCGCGSRVRVTESQAPSARCMAEGCRSVSVTGTSIRLCGQHKDEVTMMLVHDIARTELANLADLAERGAQYWEKPAIPVYEGPAVQTTEAAAIVRAVPGAGQHEPVVYFLRNGDRVKIGYTTNLHARITALSLRSHDVILLLDGGRDLEADLHRRFHRYRISSTEWFELKGEVEDFARQRPRLAEKQ